MRDPEPEQRVFTINTRGNQRYEAEIAAWVYHGVKNEKVISRKLIYQYRAENFDQARSIVDMALQTVAAVHDVWQTKLVRIEEMGM